MKDEYRVQSIDELVKLLGEPFPKLSNKVSSEIDSHCKAFIEKSPFICVATSDRLHNQDVSPKGDAAGFVKIQGTTTLLIPERGGNRLAYGFRNILETGSVGLIFIIPGVVETVRVNGKANISRDPRLLKMLSAQGKSAVLCTIVSVEECFFHCGKALLRSKLWKSESWPDKFNSDIAKQLSQKMDIELPRMEKLLSEDCKNIY